MSDSYLKVLWTCGMGEACTNTLRPGTHEDYSEAGVCCDARVDQSTAIRCKLPVDGRVSSTTNAAKTA